MDFSVSAANRLRSVPLVEIRDAELSSLLFRFAEL
jgi:hypothetical protein